MKKFSVLMIILILAGLVTVQAFAWGGGHGRRGGCGEGSPEAQLALMKETAEIRTAMETLHAELRAALAVDAPDTEKVKALYQEMAVHKAAMALKARAHGVQGGAEGCPCGGGMMQGGKGACRN